MESHYLDPKNDLAFRKIFGTEQNKDILLHFLNDLFNRAKNPIEEVTFLRTIQLPEVAAQRVSIVDVMCRDSQGHRFIVEMQVAHEKGFEKRAQFYAARAYVEQRETEQAYHDLKEIIFLAITDFTLFSEKKAYLSHHVILDKSTLEHDLKGFSFSFLELTKFNLSIDALKTMTEKWAYFFKHATETATYDLPRIIGADVILERAYTALDRYAWSPEELREYNSVEMKRQADLAILEQAFDKGREEGREEGMNEGVAKGRTETQERIARALLAEGMSPQCIAECTHLTLDEICALEVE